jgi:hypothetical protein
MAKKRVSLKGIVRDIKRAERAVRNLGSGAPLSGKRKLAAKAKALAKIKLRVQQVCSSGIRDGGFFVER